MDTDKRVAFIQAQAVCAQAEIEGMKAQNEYRKYLGENPEYVFDDFTAIQSKYMIEHNAVIEYLRD